MMGENFLEYVNLMRIERAKKLLREDEASIKEIAWQVGFNSDITFRRLFKKYEGISASDYRMISRSERKTRGGD